MFLLYLWTLKTLKGSHQSFSQRIGTITLPGKTLDWFSGTYAIMTARTQRPAGKEEHIMNKPTEVVLRVRRALWLLLSMLSLSLALVVLGAYTTTRTESLNVTGYISGVVLTLGSFLGLLGLLLEENGKQLMTAAIVFLSFGIIASFLCLMIDGVGILLNMDVRPLKAGRCQYYSSGSSSYIYENFYTTVPCWSLRESCTMTVRSGTCYCCDLYNCANGDYMNNYFEFVGVQSCEEVFTLYILIWTLTGVNLVAFFTGILTAAVLGNIKHLRSTNPMTAAVHSTASCPTAPLLTDGNTHTQQLLPRMSEFFPPGERSASAVLSESNPPSFNPLTTLPEPLCMSRSVTPKTHQEDGGKEN
ncbi:transmembrane protein 255B [Poeciliopsis prolifica]|uniref:transmembrane protein 255B n=1 Tax=Poeciliopsis prolifica TaxID=188132 RepID=UPI002413631C|nr:transmembrane protein 255B [Poeciliopsis prolifica]